MRFDIITLFPELFSAHLVHGVTRRAYAPGKIDVHLWPLRDFGDPPHARVDDRPYGGGPGMVLLAEPLARALAAIRAARAEPVPAPVISFSPAGTLLRQLEVRRIATTVVRIDDGRVSGIGGVELLGTADADDL